MKGSESILTVFIYCTINVSNQYKWQWIIYRFFKMIKNKKATINPKINDNKWFQYAIKVVLNHENIVKDPQRLSKIKPFKCNWKEINSSHKNDWKKV